LCAEVFDKVNLNEYPTLTDLRTRDLTGTGLFLQGNRMYQQKLSRLLQGKSSHALPLEEVCSLGEFKHFHKYKAGQISYRARPIL